MYYFLFVSLASMMSNIHEINPAYLDLAKIIVGSVGWIGGLTLFMWFREKRKMIEARA
jgi:hypothetical protein